jgi:hypothetical protein
MSFHVLEESLKINPYWKSPPAYLGDGILGRFLYSISITIGCKLFYWSHHFVLCQGQTPYSAVDSWLIYIYFMKIDQPKLSERKSRRSGVDGGSDGLIDMSCSKAPWS